MCKVYTNKVFRAMLDRIHHLYPVQATAGGLYAAPTLAPDVSAGGRLRSRQCWKYLS